jgi:Zn-dependent peptidase ImmA (M78 family)
MLQDLIKDFYLFAKERLGFDKNCKIILKKDCQNAKNPLGKTGYFDPDNNTIVIYISGRHQKDCVRSMAHEIVHFWQHCNGKFNNIKFENDPKYAQNNLDLRELEKEAYAEGNLLFRDWEDNKKYSKKGSLNEMFSKRNDNLLKENMKKLNKVILKEQDEEEINKLIEIAKKEGYDEKEFRQGMQIEAEHTDDLMMRSKIAKDHLQEDPKYYTKLKSLNL